MKTLYILLIAYTLILTNNAHAFNFSGALDKINKQQKDGSSPLDDGASSAINCSALAMLVDADEKTLLKAAVLCGATQVVMSTLEAQGRDDYAKKYKKIEDEISLTEKKINQYKKQTKQNNKNSSSIKKQVAKLIKQEKDDKKFIIEANKLRPKLDKNIRENKIQNSNIKARLAIINDQIKDLDAMIASSQNLKQLKDTKNKLHKQKSQLIANVEKSNNINNKLLAEKTKLDQQIIKRG